VAWASFFSGEIGDPCGFAHAGDAAYTTVVGQDGKTYQAQKGFSDNAYTAGMGSPRGCVDYPTTMCCKNSPTICSWLANGSTSCSFDPASDIVGLSIPTVGGFGSATLFLSGVFPQTSPAICLPLYLAGTSPDFCVGVQASGMIESGPATMTLSSSEAFQYPNMENCYLPSSSGACPTGTSLLAATGCCMGPLIPFHVSGATATVQTTIPGVPQPGVPVPALPRSRIVLLSVLFLGLGAFAALKRQRLSSLSR
jgi:hypothetical protein